MILLPQLNAVPVGIKIFTWNAMGNTRKGWTDVRKLFIKGNINGYDIVFLQEVQWVNEEHFISENYMLAKMTKSVNERGKQTNRNICILFDPRRLNCEESLRTDVTHVIMTVMGWSDKDSHRVCIQVFTQQGSGETFVAIGVHAPIDRQDCHTFCDLLKIAVEKINEVLALPVLLAGDFNCDIRVWRSPTFLVPEYIIDRSPIDFIALKITSDSHLAIENMTMTQYSEMIIPDDARQLHVKAQDKQRKSTSTVDQLIQKYSQDLYPFYAKLCDGHRPLSAEVKYSTAMSSTMSPEEVAGLVERVKELEDENKELKEEDAGLVERVKELEDENKELKEEVARNVERVKELEDENKKLKEKVDRLQSKGKNEHKNSKI